MKRLAVIGVLGIVLASSSGCCIIDRIFHCPCGRWRGGGCYDGCNTCAPCGGCVDNDCHYGDGMLCKQPYWHDGPIYEDGPAYATHMPRGGCVHCAHGKAGTMPGGYAEVQGPPGPPVGQVAYPYYTTRGPRDFLARNPGDIGP